MLVIGCSDPLLIAALAAKAGLSGRTCAVDESPDVATDAGRVALKEGVLVETSIAPPAAQPFDRDSFDLVVLRDVLGTAMRRRGRWPSRKRARVLRPGGRCMAIDTLARGGMAASLAAGTTPPTDGGEAIEILKGQGFVAVRTLAEREGLRFIEARQEEQLSSADTTADTHG